MPLTSAESSSGRMAPQHLKPHQAIAVLLKIKSRCWGGGKKLLREAVAPAELLSFMHLLFFKKTGTGQRSAHAHTPGLTRGLRGRFSLSWWEERGSWKRKNFILWTFLQIKQTVPPRCWIAAPTRRSKRNGWAKTDRLEMPVDEEITKEELNTSKGRLQSSKPFLSLKPSCALLSVCASA